MGTELKLHIGAWNGKSVITESYFTSPLKLGTPRTEGERLKVVLMMASAGVLKGDSFHYDITCDAGTKTFLTEQSYTKIFDTGEGKAEKRQTITVGENASLYYRPCATVPFGGSTYEGEMKVLLKKNSEFAFADIITAGRVGMGESFRFRHYRNRISAWAEDRLVWVDNCLLEPAVMVLTGMVFLDGFTHQGTFYYYGPSGKEEKLLEAFSETGEDTILHFFKDRQMKCKCGVSEALAGVCVRILAHTAQDIEEIFEELTKKLENC